MPEEKKLVDKILPKEYVDPEVDDVGLYLDIQKNEIVASDGFVMLTLTLPQMPERPLLHQFIQSDWLDEHGLRTLLPIRINAMYARLLDIWAIEIIYDVDTTNHLPIWLDLISSDGKITIYDFQIGAHTPYLKDQPKQQNLFGEEMENNLMSATKSKVLFDNLCMALGALWYHMDESLTYATGKTKNWYQFHLMMRTPMAVNSLI